MLRAVAKASARWRLVAAASRPSILNRAISSAPVIARSYHLPVHHYHHGVLNSRFQFPDDVEDDDVSDADLHLDEESDADLDDVSDADLDDVSDEEFKGFDVSFGSDGDEHSGKSSKSD